MILLTDFVPAAAAAGKTFHLYTDKSRGKIVVISTETFSLIDVIH